MINPMTFFGGGTTHSWADPTTKKEYSYNWGFGRVTDTTESDVCNFYNLAFDAKMTKLTTKEKEVMEYTARDFDVTRNICKKVLNSYFGAGIVPIFDIKRAIFNPPYTIVIWEDGTRTIVKVQGNDIYDPEKGLAMCFMKKALGNKGSYYDTVKKYVGPYMFAEEVANTEFSSLNELAALMEKAKNRTWKIFIKTYKDGECVGIGKYHREYSRKCDATRIANQRFGDVECVKTIVTQEDNIE